MAATITADDLRPDLAAALVAAAAAEGGELGRMELAVSVRWRGELYDDDRWSAGEPDPLERTARRSTVLSDRAGYWLARWLALPRPRPRLDDDWLDAELTLAALGGGLGLHEQLPGWFPRLLRPWREAGGSVRLCGVCGAELSGRQRSTCSGRCRVALHRARQATTEATAAVG